MIHHEDYYIVLQNFNLLVLDAVILVTKFNVCSFNMMILYIINGSLEDSSSQGWLKPKALSRIPREL